MHKLFKLMILFLGTWTLPVWASQHHFAQDNDTIYADIALQDLTRVHVMGDRIASVYGLDGRYTLQTDNVHGDVYVQPSIEKKSSLLTFFLVTEKGQSYTVIGKLKDIPATALIITPTPVSATLQHQPVNNSAHDKALTQLIKAMIKEEILPGYVNVMPDSQAQYYQNGLQATVKSRWVGEGLNAQVLMIKNTTRQPLTLKESWFITPHAKAIALSQSTLAPLSHTFVYRIES